MPTYSDIFGEGFTYKFIFGEGFTYKLIFGEGFTYKGFISEQEEFDIFFFHLLLNFEVLISVNIKLFHLALIINLSLTYPQF